MFRVFFSQQDRTHSHEEGSPFILLPFCLTDHLHSPVSVNQNGEHTLSSMSLCQNKTWVQLTGLNPLVKCVLQQCIIPQEWCWWCLTKWSQLVKQLLFMRTNLGCAQVSVSFSFALKVSVISRKFSCFYGQLSHTFALCYQFPLSKHV